MTDAETAVLEIEQILGDLVAFWQKYEPGDSFVRGKQEIATNLYKIVEQMRKELGLDPLPIEEPSLANLSF